MQEKKNLPAEIVWSVLRRSWSPGFERLLQVGIDEGWYDLKVPLEASVTYLPSFLP